MIPGVQVYHGALSLTCIFCNNLNPADTLRNNDVVITSKRRHFDVITSKWRRFDVITTLSLRHVLSGKLLACWHLSIQYQLIPIQICNGWSTLTPALLCILVYSHGEQRVNTRIRSPTWSGCCAARHACAVISSIPMLPLELVHVFQRSMYAWTVKRDRSWPGKVLAG